MEKYLFTDGTNGMREVNSQEELKTLIAAAAQPDKIRIWIYNSSEWISYDAFAKRFLSNNKKKTSVPVAKDNSISTIEEKELTAKPVKHFGWIKKSFLFIVVAAGIFLVYNFTKIKWVKAPSLTITADRPVNVPLLDMDSLIQMLEIYRGQKLDKVTRTNLRIRNTWPERIALQLNTDRDTSNTGSRYYNMELSIDNTTGYVLDNAVVKLMVWKDNSISSTDTFHFSNISYATAAKRKLMNNYRGDSISVSFQSVKAKVFNFCYSSDKKSNYGNNNDKWFCKE